jgi:acyl carrier protein
MTEAEALEMIKSAINEVSAGAGDEITMETHLADDDVLDSLDLMNFLFELEQLKGSKIEEITETFDDYRVATLAGFLTKA